MIINFNENFADPFDANLSQQEREEINTQIHIENYQQIAEQLNRMERNEKNNFKK